MTTQRDKITQYNALDDRRWYIYALMAATDNERDMDMYAAELADVLDKMLEIDEIK
jgi:hypothetical protein